MAYGSPERLADVPAYYADIRGGRPIPPAVLQDLVERYRRLGIEDGRRSMRSLPRPVRHSSASSRRACLHRMKHWTPHIAEAAEAALQAARTRSSTGAGAALLVDVHRGLPQQLERGLGGRAELGSSGAGTTSQASSTCSLNVCADGGARRLPQPTLCPRGSSNPATPTRTSCSKPRSWSQSGSARGMVVLLPERVSERASPGSGRTSSTICGTARPGRS